MTDAMRSFWEGRAEEQPFFYVDNRLDYHAPDLERFWGGGVRELDRLLSLLGVELDSGDVVVEIGCGVGRLTRAISPRVRRVLAIDISARMLDLAQEHNSHLGNVDWMLGDGASLAGVRDACADCCISHVVFQHIPDPAITLGYVREMGRVLRPGGWAGFQVSNDPSAHRPARGGRRLAAGVRALARRGPSGLTHRAWLGSAVDLDELRGAAAAGAMHVERIEGEGTQFCLVLLRRRLAE